MSNKTTAVEKRTYDSGVALTKASSTFDAYNISIPDDIAKEVDHMIAVNTNAMSAVSFMECGGASCPYASNCLLQKRAVAPVGKPCYYEVRLYESWLASLVTKGDVDVTDSYTMMQLSSIVELMLLKRRCLLNMAVGGPGKRFRDLLVESEKLGPKDQILLEYTAHPLLGEYRALDSRIAKALKELVATPLERDKKIRARKEHEESADPSVVMAALVTELLKDTKGRKLVDFTPTKSDIIEAEYDDVG